MYNDRLRLDIEPLDLVAGYYYGADAVRLDVFIYPWIDYLTNKT